ncbi:S8 family serine peptidase [Capilliphycus salinus ALCB114379]|uniref:S8 family serine peptidase n=1 Tax=Capilliphycus salinus TaxID=2768948 RepID=UPI0039A6526C
MGLFTKLLGSSSKRQPASGFQSQSKKLPSQETFILEPILTPSGLVDGGDDSPDPIIIESELLDEIESELNSEVETQSEEDLTPVEVSNLDEGDEVEIPFVTELEELEIEDNSETSEENLAESNEEITSDDTESSSEKPENSETEITETTLNTSLELNEESSSDLESSPEVEESSTENQNETVYSSEETSEVSSLEESPTEETASELEEISDESTLEESEAEDAEITTESEVDESIEETESSTYSETENSNNTDTVNESENETDSNGEIIEEIVSSPVDFNFDSGIFTVGETGEIGIDYLFDGGGFGRGELAIFSLEGMEELDLSLEEFIKEAANRALSDSELGHVVISDGNEGAKFSGGLGGETDFNRGEYLGVKTFNMRPGDKFAVMLVPNGKVQQVFDNPNAEESIRPLFSLSTANPEDGFQLGQIADVTGDGNTFVFEDWRVDDSSDRDYNDIIFQVRGASGEAVHLDEVINPNKDWRSSDMGQALIEYAQPYITPDEPIVEIENNLSNLLTDLEGLLDEGESETEVEIDEEVSNSEVVETEVIDDEIVEVLEEEASLNESTELVESSELEVEESEVVEIEDNSENPVVEESVVVEIVDNLEASIGESTATESEQIEVEESLVSSIVEETEESEVITIEDNLENPIVEESEVVEIQNSGDTPVVEESSPELEETEVEENLSTAVVEETEELSVIEIEESENTPILQQTEESVVTEIEDNLETSIVEETEESEVIEIEDNSETSTSPTEPTVIDESSENLTVEEPKESEVIEIVDNSETSVVGEAEESEAVEIENLSENPVVEENLSTRTVEEPEESEVIEIVDNSENSTVEETENNLETILTEEFSPELEETELQETSEVSLIAELEQSETVAVEDNLENSGVEKSEETELVDVDNSSETSTLPVYATEFEDVENNWSEASPTSTSESPTAILVSRLENLTYNLQNQTLSETPVNSNLIQQLEQLTDRLKTQSEFNPNPPVSSTTLQLIEQLETQLVTQPVLPATVEPPVDFEFPAENQPLIGIIDTGFSGNNPDIDYSRITWGSDKVDGDSDPTLTPGEGNEHGTHILGLIAAKQDNGIGIDGINNNAPIWAGRAIGSGRWAESLVEFVDAAVESGQPNAVVNLSLDLTQIDAEGNVTTRYEFTPLEMAALEYARQNNVLVAVAAGNEGGVMSALGQASQQFDNIITVGSAQKIDGKTSVWQGFDRAEYSNYGNGLDIVADSGTLENPVISTVGDGIGAMDGTSVATAKVTGAISQVWAANPELNYRQVIDIIKATATDLQDANPDVETGAGLLNIAAAIHLAKVTKPEEYNPDLQVVPTTWSGEGKVTPTERAVRYRYEMKAGDTLWGIAQRELGNGSRWTEITKDPAGKTPFTSAEASRLSIGQAIYLPGNDPHPQPQPQPTPQPQPQPQPQPTPQPSSDTVKQAALNNFLKPFGNLQSSSWSNFLKEMFEKFYNSANKTLNSKAPQQGTGTSVNATPQRTPTQSVKTLAGKKIILDPGHGITNTGFDPGAVGYGTTEATENLHQAKLIANHLRQLGAEVKVLDEPLSLAQIGQRAAGHDIFVSLHQNAFNKNAQGHEVYSHPNAPAKDAQLAQAINSELDAIFPDRVIPNRGTKKADFSVLRNAPTNVPAVLVESLFIDAPGMSRANVEKAATAVARGIEKFFTGKVTGSTPPPSNPTTPKPTPSSTSGVVNSKVGSLPLNFRSGSFVGASIIGNLPKGTPLKILKSVTGGTYNPGTGSRNDWYQIEVNGKTGYVAAYYVDVKSSSKPTQTSFNLKPGGTNLDFRRGQEWVTSTGYKFKFQTDGNLVLYDRKGKAIWATGTHGTNADRFSVQTDGNVVLYDRGKPVWATNTAGNKGAYFAIQGDGNLVVYSSNRKALFNTGTVDGRQRTLSASAQWLRDRNLKRFPGLKFSTVVSKATGKALDAGGKNNSVYPHSSPNSKNEYHQWGFEKVGNYYMIINKATGKALDGGGDGGKLPYAHPDPQKNNSYQLWKLQKVGDAYLIVNKATGRALDSGGANGNHIYMHPNPIPGNSFHQWKLNLPNSGGSSTKTGYVNSSIGLNLRRDPSTNQAKISTLPNGTKLTILEKVTGQPYYPGNRTDWYKVKVGNTVGYVAAYYVSEGKEPDGGSSGNPLLNRQPAQYFRNRPQFYTTGNIFAQSMYGSSLVGGRGYTEGNCTWYAHGRLLEIGKSPAALRTMSGNANQWHNQMSNGSRIVSSPQVGDIAQWTANGQNHVAVVETVHPNGTITISESHYRTNWDAGGTGTLHWVRTIPASSPTRYIRVPNA